MIQTFEEYLRDECWEDEGVLDDNMSDKFDDWLGQLDGQEYIDFADEYAKYVQYETVSDIQDKLATQTIRLHDELKSLRK